MHSRIIGTAIVATALFAGAAAGHQMHGYGQGPGQGPEAYGMPQMMGPSGCPMMGGPMMGGPMMGGGMIGGPMTEGGMMGGMGHRPTIDGIQDGGHFLPQDLSVDDVRHILGHRIAMSGNPNLKLGEVTVQDDEAIIAKVVTQEDSLVRTFSFNRHTGAMRPVDGGQ